MKLGEIERLTELGGFVVPFLTIVSAIFVAELTDKDAILLLTLATRADPWRVFAAGSVAFAISSAIIVLLGSTLILFIPIFWIKVAGGVIMLGYTIFQYVKGLREEANIERKGESLAQGRGRGVWAALFAMIFALIVLDLAGDATELLTVVFVAQYENYLVVFLGAVVALTAASAVEVTLGNRLARFLSAKRLRYFSAVVFLIIGSVILLSAAF